MKRWEDKRCLVHNDDGVVAGWRWFFFLNLKMGEVQNFELVGFWDKFIKIQMVMGTFPIRD